MEGATGSAYRWAISVPIRRSRGKKGGLWRNLYCRRMKKGRKMGSRMSSGSFKGGNKPTEEGRDLMSNAMIVVPTSMDVLK